MPAEKQIPLDELLFGSKLDRTAKRVPSLAEVISVCYREGQARLFRGQIAGAETKSPLSQATDETGGAACPKSRT